MLLDMLLKTNVYVVRDHDKVSVALPGLSKDQVKVTQKDDYVYIDVKEETPFVDKGTLYLYVPKKVNRAEFKNGVLTLHLENQENLITVE